MSRAAGYKKEKYLTPFEVPRVWGTWHARCSVSHDGLTIAMLAGTGFLQWISFKLMTTVVENAAGYSTAVLLSLDVSLKYFPFKETQLCGNSFIHSTVVIPLFPSGESVVSGLRGITRLVSINSQPDSWDSYG